MAREPDVALWMTSVIFLQSDQQHHAAPEVASTVRSMLLKRKFRDICHCLKLLILLKNAHVS